VLTRFTADALPGVDLFAPEPRRFRSADGTAVAGWLIRDPEAPRPGPLMLDVHGGPHNAWTPSVSATHLYHQVLAAAGVTVLLLNPRGSDGYGEQFLTAAVGSWGVADHADVLGPVQQLVDEGVADPDRLGVCGYSYGGYLTCYLTGRTDRFAAAVAGGVVADLRSMIGTSDQGQHLGRRECLAPPYGDDEALRAQSPIERIDRVRTPTLILQGAADLACPLGQAEQWFTGLHQRGVPAELVVYPDAVHEFIVTGRPSHRVDYNTRIVEWMTRRLCADHDDGARTTGGAAAPALVC
jgi:dipeptidyl aminopeptidase/acylaminoacyl peptidase